jgi:son of sevenless-like protein
MNGLAGSVAPPGQLYVRALYDYDADDRISLSFRANDIIQVITQLESGWWDGVRNGVRGWFPSNYCSVISPPYDEEVGQYVAAGAAESEADESEEEYHNRGANHIANGAGSRNGGPTIRTQEEAAFWIPQATPDGRLFYFNTLTGASTMELPLESPSSATETGPHDRTNVFIPDQTRPPADIMSGNHERDEETDYASASEAEEIPFSTSLNRPGRSHPMNGVSPAASMDSLSDANGLNAGRAGMQDSFSALQQGIPPIGTTMTSFANASGGMMSNTILPRRFFDDSQAEPMTWDALLRDTTQHVARYCETIRNSNRSEYVRRAEDISDHVRLLLAAASGTTDNHSGNPSIISNNKALYPHFREMMSRFSKLVLSSHIASADFPAVDSHQKCLQEAELFKNGVMAFVDVARQQRGEEIPRLTPGFVTGSTTAGNWQTNGLATQNPLAGISFIDDEPEVAPEPAATLDRALLQRMDELKQMIMGRIRRLDEHLTLREKLITPQKHRQIATTISKSASQVIETCQPYLSAIESIDLSPLSAQLKTVQLHNFAEQKQKMYDATADLVVACQDVSMPLADEWAEVRGPSMEDRMHRVKAAGRELDTACAQVFHSLSLLAESMPPAEKAKAMEEHRRTVSNMTFDQHSRNVSTASRPSLAGSGQSHSFSEGSASTAASSLESTRVPRNFGESPASTEPTRDSDEMPSYLRLDHDGELTYETKNGGTTLRGGTLLGLVEQLTRHDRLDSRFNNAFLLTYKSFTTASELFAMLVKRWTIQPPPGLSGDDLQIWTDKKQKPIRFRVVNVLKSWFDNYWMEPGDEASKQTMQEIYKFAKDTVQSTSTPGAGPLMTAIEQRMRSQDASSKRMVLTMSNQAPAPIVPKNLKKLKFLDIDPLEFARQLTILEFKLYTKIKVTECLGQAWQKKLEEGEPDPAENLKALIYNSNQLTNWVAQMVLTQGDVKRRAAVIKHFVLIADRCRQLNNFSCLTSIISAMGSAPIHRLSRTWTQVNTRTSATLEVLRKLMGSSKNFSEYRETLNKANPPCIPFFGIYLTDLVFIEDGIPSNLKKTTLINFGKRIKTAEIIRDIQQYQNVPYGLQPVPELQDYVQKNMSSASDVHEMYERSLQVEPREREDEKIAR